MTGLTISPGGRCCCGPCEPHCDGDTPTLCVAIDGLADRTDLGVYEQCQSCTIVNGKKYSVTSLGECGGSSPFLNCWACWHPSTPYPLTVDNCFDADWTHPNQTGRPWYPHAGAASSVHLKTELESGVYYLYGRVSAGKDRRAVYRAELGTERLSCADSYTDQELDLLRFEKLVGFTWLEYTDDSHLNTDCDWAGTTLETFATCDDDADRYNCGCEPGTAPSTLILTIESGFKFTEALPNDPTPPTPGVIDLGGSYTLAIENEAGPCASDCVWSGEFSISPFLVKHADCRTSDTWTANAIKIYAFVNCHTEIVTVAAEWLRDDETDYNYRDREALATNTFSLAATDFEEKNHRLDCGGFSDTPADIVFQPHGFGSYVCGPKFTPDCWRGYCKDIYPDWPGWPGAQCEICPTWKLS